MTLSKAEIKALIEIYSGKKSIRKLAESLHVGISSVSVAVSSLEKKHLCMKIRHGKHIEIGMADTSLAIAFRKLIIQSKPLKLDKFLFGLRFRILSACLYEAKATDEIADMLKVSRKSVQNVIYTFLSRLILKREKRRLIFQKKAWPFLYDFLDAYRKFSLNGDILWRFEDEMVFEIREKSEVKGAITGFTAYAEYHVPVLNVKFCCYLPERRLAKIDVFMHSLLQIGDDTRLLELAIAFFKKNRLKNREMLKMAPKYDLRKKVQDFVLILNSKEEKIKTETLPLISRRGIRDVMKLYKEA